MPKKQPQLDGSLERHLTILTKQISGGKVIPFLGAGVNLAGRPPGTSFECTKTLPSGTELASYLAKTFGYPSIEAENLTRVSQYVAVMTGSGPLYDELRSVFKIECNPSPLHHLLAALSTRLRGNDRAPDHQLIVTTNYDDLLERAFEAEDQPFDLLIYIADGENAGRFLHRPPDGSILLIEKPNEYRGLDFKRRPAILKIHGTLDRTDSERDSFVITEDHYINYLAHVGTSSMLPPNVINKLRRSNFLFLGYSLRDWNLRVFLHRIWGEQKLTYNSWAIQRNPNEIEKKFWEKRNVEIYNIDLERYVAELARRVGNQ